MVATNNHLRLFALLALLLPLYAAVQLWLLAEPATIIEVRTVAEPVRVEVPVEVEVPIEVPVERIVFVPVPVPVLVPLEDGAGADAGDEDAQGAPPAVAPQVLIAQQGALGTTAPVSAGPGESVAELETDVAEADFSLDALIAGGLGPGVGFDGPTPDEDGLAALGLEGSEHPIPPIISVQQALPPASGASTNQAPPQVASSVSQGSPQVVGSASQVVVAPPPALASVPPPSAPGVPPPVASSAPGGAPGVSSAAQAPSVSPGSTAAVSPPSSASSAARSSPSASSGLSRALSQGSTGAPASAPAGAVQQNRNGERDDADERARQTQAARGQVGVQPAAATGRQQAQQGPSNERRDGGSAARPGGAPAVPGRDERSSARPPQDREGAVRGAGGNDDRDKNAAGAKGKGR